MQTFANYAWVGAAGMSKMERDSWRESACLCGKGQVTRHVVSTDYPFGGADVSLSLDCQYCSAVWRLDGRSLVDRTSEAKARSAHDRWWSAAEELGVIAVGLIDRYIAGMDLRTRKAELTELVRLDLASDDYRSYAAARRNGASPGRAANYHRNHEALKTIAGRDCERVEQLINQVAALRAEWDVAGALVIRRPLPKQ